MLGSAKQDGGGFFLVCRRFFIKRCQCRTVRIPLRVWSKHTFSLTGGCSETHLCIGANFFCSCTVLLLHIQQVDATELVCCGFILIQNRNFTETGNKSATVVATSGFILKCNHNPSACLIEMCTLKFYRHRTFCTPLESNQDPHCLDLLKQ